MLNSTPVNSGMLNTGYLLYIDVGHLDVTRLNTFKSPSIHQLERLGFAQPGRPPLTLYNKMRGDHHLGSACGQTG